MSALGLAGRYLGGQASQRGQRFWARGEDPDQFAGWFGQSKCSSQRPLLSFKGSVVARFTWKPSRGRSRFFRISLPVGRLTVGDVRPELTFSLVLTPRMVTDPSRRSKPRNEKKPDGTWPRLTIRRRAGFLANTFVLFRRTKRPDKAHAYNRLRGTCAH